MTAVSTPHAARHAAIRVVLVATTPCSARASAHGCGASRTWSWSARTVRGDDAVALALRTRADVIVLNLETAGAARRTVAPGSVRDRAGLRVPILNPHAGHAQPHAVLDDGPLSAVARDAAERDLLDVLSSGRLGT